MKFRFFFFFWSFRTLGLRSPNACVRAFFGGRRYEKSKRRKYKYRKTENDGEKKKIKTDDRREIQTRITTVVTRPWWRRPVERVRNPAAVMVGRPGRRVHEWTPRGPRRLRPRRRRWRWLRRFASRTQYQHSSVYIHTCAPHAHCIRRFIYKLAHFTCIIHSVYYSFIPWMADDTRTHTGYSYSTCVCVYKCYYSLWREEE